MSKRFLVVVVLMMAITVPSAPSVQAHGDDAAVIIEWNALLQSTMPATAGLQAFRFYAMLHVAMFDAVNSIEERYRPYHVNVRASHGASAEAAAAQAGRDVLSFLIPGSTATYDAALAARLATIAPGRRAQGVWVGKRVAEKIIALRHNDGWQLPATPYVLPPFPGLWQPTPPANAAAAFTQLPGTTPFALLTNTQFLPPAPPTLTSPKYAQDFDEVKSVGKSDSGTRTAAQTQQAQLWAGVITSTNLNATWNNVAREAVLAKGLDLVDAARVFALVDVAMNDSILTSHSSKFVYAYWRPVTAIRRAAEDMNDATEAVTDWLPLLATPPYPSYSGNMACVGAGAATALALAFDTNDVSIKVVWKGNANSTPPFTDVEKVFPGFWEIAVDEADSRVFGGIHFRFDNDASQQVCPKVAKFAFDNYMQPKHDGWRW
jgi:hypothetical protein